MKIESQLSKYAEDIQSAKKALDKATRMPAHLIDSKPNKEAHK